MLEGSRFSGQLLKTRREHWWKPAYQISLDGRVVTTVNAKRWGGGVGRFRLDGQDYRLRASMRRTKYTLLNADGMVVATAELPGLPLRIQVFVLATMLILWDSQYLMAG